MKLNASEMLELLSLIQKFHSERQRQSTRDGSTHGFGCSSPHLHILYCDGLGFEGGIGTSAILYIQDRETKVLQCYLGTDKQHTIYEAEGVGYDYGFTPLK